MGFFGWFFLIIFSIYFIFKYFGRYITAFLLQRLMKRVSKNFETQARDYDRNYGGDPYYDNIHVDENIEVKIPKNQPSPKDRIPGLESIAEDVEFEEFEEDIRE